MSKLEKKVLASYQAIRLPRRRSYGNLNDMLFDEHQRLQKNAPLTRKQGWFWHFLKVPAKRKVMKKWNRS